MQKKNIKPIIKKSLGLLLAAGLTISLIPSSLSAENPYWYSMYISSGTDEKEAFRQSGDEPARRRQYVPGQ